MVEDKDLERRVEQNVELYTREGRYTAKESIRDNLLSLVPGGIYYVCSKNYPDKAFAATLDIITTVLTYGSLWFSTFPELTPLYLLFGFFYISRVCIVKEENFRDKEKLRNFISDRKRENPRGDYLPGNISLAPKEDLEGAISNASENGALSLQNQGELSLEE